MGAVILNSCTCWVSISKSWTGALLSAEAESRNGTTLQPRNPGYLEPSNLGTFEPEPWPQALEAWNLRTLESLRSVTNTRATVETWKTQTLESPGWNLGTSEPETHELWKAGDSLATPESFGTLENPGALKILTLGTLEPWQTLENPGTLKPWKLATFELWNAMEP